MGPTGASTRTFSTSDGADLNYYTQGSGPTVLMLPGWSQSAAMFHNQLAGLSDRFTVISLDHRGHGESANIQYGYRISRLSQDVREFILELGLENVNLLGNSMGASVMWGYWNLYGGDKLARMIIDDEPTALTLPMPSRGKANVESSYYWKVSDQRDQIDQESGEIFPWKTLVDTCDSLSGPHGAAATRQMISNMMSDRLAPEVQEWVIAENMKLPRESAATLLFNHSLEDWRDVLPRINIPVQMIAGKASVVPWKSQVWIMEQIPDARIEVLQEKDGGYHFSFLENPKRFNQIVSSFINAT
jgi:pimeloyl-ACP methyl ester carboxylesterase